MCGERKRAHFFPEAEIIEERKIAVEPFPFVPPTRTHFVFSCGLPRRERSLLILCSPGFEPNIEICESFSHAPEYEFEFKINTV